MFKLIYCHEENSVERANFTELADKRFAFQKRPYQEGVLYAYHSSVSII